MRADLVLLTFAYVLSQFYRTVLAVLAQVLEADIGAGAEALATASGLWFLAFAVMQIPVGWALDHLGPRRVAAVLLAVAGAGAAVVSVTVLPVGPALLLCAAVTFALRSGSLLFGWRLPVYRARPPRR